MLPSVLQVPSEHTKNLLAFHWNDNLTEIREYIPDILDFMAAVDIRAIYTGENKTRLM